MLNRFLSILCIALILSTTFVTPTQAEEEIVVFHSLDELPSSEHAADTEVIRTHILENIDATQENHTHASYSKELDPSTIVLLGEKMNYEKSGGLVSSLMLTPSLTPTLIPVNTFVPQTNSLPSEVNLIEEFLALGKIDTLSG